ncbi:MAG TPA: hypothetical protein VKH37_06150, partial [Ferruginibacter sp.]|nr:hypothetical protein [Ferruginibacter sp.]
LINKKIVAQLQAFACNAIGLTGADASVLPATKRPVAEIDYGFVGDPVENISSFAIETFLETGLTPVLAPLTHDGMGQLLNTNADTIASVIAVALSKKYSVRLIYCFEKKGVLNDVNDENSIVPLITKDVYDTMIAENKLHDGMLPKIQNAFTALSKGVNEIVIGHADDLLKNVSEKNTGTLIRN